MNKLFLSVLLLLVLSICVSAVHVSVDVDVANTHQHHKTEHKHHGGNRPFHALAEELALDHSASKHTINKPVEAEVDEAEAELDDANDESLIEAHKLPNPSITPGTPLASIDLGTLCQSGYTAQVRDVPQSVKDQVYRNYGINANNQGFCQGPQGCEVDHLISLEIGGSNDITNLWPQPYFGATNAHNKDQLENKLHSLVCAQTITLQEAQQAISTNWIDAYNKYVGPLS